MSYIIKVINEVIYSMDEAEDLHMYSNDNYYVNIYKNINEYDCIYKFKNNTIVNISNISYVISTFIYNKEDYYHIFRNQYESIDSISEIINIKYIELFNKYTINYNIYIYDPYILYKYLLSINLINKLYYFSHNPRKTISINDIKKFNCMRLYKNFIYI